MSVPTVARKEFGDTRRSRTLVAVVFLFVLVIGGVTYLYVEFFTSASPGQQPDSAAELTATAVAILGGLIPGGLGPLSLLVPLIGLLLGYKAIVGERETGQIKLLLGLPHSRRDVVLGKLLGRSAVAGLAVVAGFVAATVVIAGFGSGVTLAPLATLLVVTLLFALAYVSIGIGISAVSPAQGWATILVVAVVGVFQALWGVIFFGIQAVFFDLGTPLPEWVRGIRAAAPPDAYRNALTAALRAVTDADVGPAASPSDAPVFLQDWFGFVWLALWTVVPLVVGYLRFRETELT